MKWETDIRYFTWVDNESQVGISFTFFKLEIHYYRYFKRSNSDLKFKPTLVQIS